MSGFGITDKGFVIKRLDSILEEIHSDLTEGFGFDTRLTRPSFLDVLVTTFAGQISDLWETAQDSYYAKYPATATGLNLDNAVQYGGIRRKPNRRTMYSLHCTGDDGTVVREKALVATDTKPAIRLFSSQEFKITREAFNSVDILVAVAETGLYSITLNGKYYSYLSKSKNEIDIIQGLKLEIKNSEFEVSVVDNNKLRIVDLLKYRNSELELSENLTTDSVTTIANFYTEDFGKINLPFGIVKNMVNNITGFNKVENLLEANYGRLEETDVELRQSYMAKSAIRSNTMIESIVAELLNNVENVESACGYENDTDHIDSRGLPPHSVEIIVEGGDNTEIANAILRRKAGGIQTHGNIVINTTGIFDDEIPIRFNRPTYLYLWLKIVLHGDKKMIPKNFATLAKQSLIYDGSNMIAGKDLLIQKLTEGIYRTITGVNYIDILVAYSSDENYTPKSSEYVSKNIFTTLRQKVLFSEKRIEVVISES